MNNKKLFKIAYSHFLGHTIMCVKYNSDKDWYFCYVDEQKQPISKIYKAQLKHSVFSWHD